MKWQSIEKVRPVNTGYSTYYPETVQVTDQFPAVFHRFVCEYDKWLESCDRPVGLWQVVWRMWCNFQIQ